MKFVAFSIVLAMFVLSVHAAPTPTNTRERLSEQLKTIKKKIVRHEENLLRQLRRKKVAKERVKAIRKLMSLQRKEKDLQEKRIAELKRFLSELDSRKVRLRDRIDRNGAKIRGLLFQVDRSFRLDSLHLPMNDNDDFVDPRNEVLRRLVQRGIHQIEILRNDLADAEQLESQIREERDQLDYIFEDMKERAGLLAFHEKLQLETIQKNHSIRVEQLNKYRKLKHAEDQVSQLIDQFNARLEFEKTTATEQLAVRNMYGGEFAKMRGKLPLPLGGGEVVSRFGRRFDPESKLHVFRKGVEFVSDNSQEVQAIFAGRVVYSGKVPSYGNVTIIDHGAKFYSLSGKLSSLKRKVGDFVKQGDAIGLARGKKPIYFEIRSKNVAVNPLQWISRSSKI